MATLSLRQQANVTITSGGEVKNLGSVTQADTITLTEIEDMTLAITSGTELTLWKTDVVAGKEITDFDFLWVESDVAATLLLEGDTNAATGTTSQNYVSLAAGIPFVLASDATLDGTDTGSFDGVAVNIDKVVIKPGANAVVRFVIGT